MLFGITNIFQLNTEIMFYKKKKKLRLVTKSVQTFFWSIYPFHYITSFI
jgi:hypothetical protein